MLTSFQHEYLKKIVVQGFEGRSINKIIFAVTSANHENTRRNPVPLYLRAVAIDELASTLGCDFKIYPIPDTKLTDKFASYIIKQIFYQSGEELTVENTILVCSTPSVSSLFKKLGFQNLTAELIEGDNEEYSTLRPYEITDLIVASGDGWRQKDAKWRQYADSATQNVYDKYDLGDTIIELFKDSLLGEDADITETRNYDTYASSMDEIIKIKFEDIKPFIVEGKIVDVGSSTGSLVALLAKEFNESDIIGIEAVRKFYEFAKSKEYESPYVFFYRRNVTDQNFKPNSVNTFIYSSILHEVYSYLGQDILKKVLQNTFEQLAHNGRIIIRDVVGPEEPNKKVFLELADNDGADSGELGTLSTRAKFFKFASDFLPRKIKFQERILGGKSLVRLRLQDAYEFMSKKNYIDNWKSEMHEEFGFYSFSLWRKELERVGFEIVPGSHPFKNEYIVANSYSGKVNIYSMVDGKLMLEKYPPTNMILVGKKI